MRSASLPAFRPRWPTANSKPWAGHWAGRASNCARPPLGNNEGPGNALVATLAYQHVCEVATEFGEKGLSADRVACSLVTTVKAYQESDAALGPNLADQWLLPLALAVNSNGGAATFTCTELTDHATTNIGVIEQFLPVTFEVEAIAAGSSVRVAAVGRA